MNAFTKPIPAASELDRLRYEVSYLTSRIARETANAIALKDLVEARITAKRALDAYASPATTNIDALEFRRLEQAAETTYSNLVCAIEDVLCVSGAKLAEALA